MNKNTVVVVMIFALMSQVACGLGVLITNRSANGMSSVNIDPVWSGTQRRWINLDFGKSQEYKTGLHHVKSLLLRNTQRQCLSFYLEPLKLRGTGSIQITVDDTSDSIIVTGYTDMVRKDGTRLGVKENVGGRVVFKEGIIVKGTPFQCDRVGNWQ